jgi:hypothetical protein
MKLLLIPAQAGIHNHDSLRKSAEGTHTLHPAS